MNFLNKLFSEIEIKSFTSVFFCQNCIKRHDKQILHYKIKNNDKHFLHTMKLYDKTASPKECGHY